MALRSAAPALALVALCASLGGAGGFASLALLAAIVAGGARLLEAVGQVVERRDGRPVAALAAVGLLCLVAAGATHVALLVLGLFACAALELLVKLDAGVEAPATVEPVELSRAA